MMKKHLIEGARKGAFSLEEAEKRFETWLKDKDSKLQNAVDKLVKDKQADEKATLEREVKVNQDRAAELAKKKAQAEKAAKGEIEPTEETVEEQVLDSAEEAPAESTQE
jgi:small subunit ribosomal protein S16